MVQLLWRTFWQFLKKLDMELPYGPAILLLGICAKAPKARTQTYLSISLYSDNIDHSQKTGTDQ